MAAFFSRFFDGGPKQNKEHIFPGERFSVVQGAISGKPVIGSINQAYRDYDKKTQYPWCLKLTIVLEPENVYESGMPTSEESQIASRLEDDLLKEIKSIATAHYIGHLFNSAFLHVYVYLDERKKVHEFLEAQTHNHLIRVFGFEIILDPQWTTVQGLMK